MQDAWKEKHQKKGCTRFIYDGIVDEALWQCQTTPRVCYFLKEAYTGEAEGFSLTNWLAESREPWMMWKKVAVWTKAIHSALTEPQAFDSAQISAKAQQLIRSISVVNVKKSNGTPHSDGEEISLYAEEDRAELYKELILIDPEVILCGYTLDSFRKVVGEELSEYSIHDSRFGCWRGALVIDYFHPACRYPNAVNYYALMAICQTARTAGCCCKYMERTKA